MASSVVQLITFGTSVASKLAALKNECRCLHDHYSDQLAQIKLLATEIRRLARELHNKLTEKGLIPLERSQNLEDSLEQIEDSLEKLSDALFDGGNDHEARQNRFFHTRHTHRQCIFLRSKIKAASRTLDLALQGLRVDLNTYLLKTKTVGRGDHDFVNDPLLSQKLGECVSCNAYGLASEGD